jgi:23S rRNA (cytosine1962-C5)-methyltransferase
MKFPTSWTEYELLDFGKGRKLERFGELITDRPEPGAEGFQKSNPGIWSQAGYHFTEEKGQKGAWNHPVPDTQISYLLGEKNLNFLLRQTAFKHLGIFPEQAENWEFIAGRCAELTKAGVIPKVLNLFAYTGAASLVASVCGAEVTHIDSSKSVVNWARENAELNGITNIRWIVEDARKFVEKSLRRGDEYHGIIMDPPIFGMAPKGPNWKLNQHLPALLENVMQLLHPQHHFFVLNTYSPQLPKSALDNILRSTPGFPKNFESTTLGLTSTTGQELELGNLVRV